MFFKQWTNEHLVEVMEPTDPFSPNQTEAMGRHHYGKKEPRSGEIFEIKPGLSHR